MRTKYLYLTRYADYLKFERSWLSQKVNLDLVEIVSALLTQNAKNCLSYRQEEKKKVWKKSALMLGEKKNALAALPPLTTAERALRKKSWRKKRRETIRPGRLGIRRRRNEFPGSCYCSLRSFLLYLSLSFSPLLPPHCGGRACMSAHTVPCCSHFLSLPSRIKFICINYVSDRAYLRANYTPEEFSPAHRGIIFDTILLTH